MHHPANNDLDQSMRIVLTNDRVLAVIGMKVELVVGYEAGQEPNDVVCTDHFSLLLLGGKLQLPLHLTVGPEVLGPEVLQGIVVGEEPFGEPAAHHVQPGVCRGLDVGLGAAVVIGSLEYEIIYNI